MLTAWKCVKEETTCMFSHGHKNSFIFLIRKKDDALGRLVIKKEVKFIA